MAGVSGPCPQCGQPVTSPAAPPVAASLFAPAPQWPPAAAAPAPMAAPPPQEPPAPTWTPPPAMGAPAAAAPQGFPPAPQGFGSPPQGFSPAPQGFPPAPQTFENPPGNTGGMGGLPPRRNSGQPPLSTSLSGGGGSPAWGASPPMPGGASPLPQGGAPFNQSRLIPGSPMLPNGPGPGGQGLGGMPSLLGRDVAPAPVSHPSQPLNPAPLSPLSPLSMGGPPGGSAPAAGAPAGVPPARKMADLREPRGASFIRLAFAAVFLLGFLGLVGFFLKDYLPPGVLALFQRDHAVEELPVVAELPPGAPALPTPPVLPPEENTTPDRPKAQMATFDPAETTPAPTTAETPPAPTSAPVPPAEDPLKQPEGALEVAKALPLTDNPAEPATLGSTSMSTPTAPAGASLEDDDGQVPEAARPAVAALRSFLAATTLEERLRHTLGADLMKPLMERYYARAPEGAVVVDRVQFIRLDPNPELGSGRHCILSLENKTWEFPVPVMLEEQPDGFKVDWLAFVEFKDRLLEKFFQTYQEGPMRFHVGIMRHHYFDDGVPNKDRKDAFRIGPAPPNTFQAYAFLEKDSDLATQLRTRLPWEHHVWAIVDLEWKKLGSQQWVEVVGVPQMHWYSLPTAPRAGSGTSTAAVKTTQKPSVQELPPGISKNGAGRGNSAQSLPPAGISKNGVGSGGVPNPPPPGVRKSNPNLPPTIRRPVEPGR